MENWSRELHRSKRMFKAGMRGTRINKKRDPQLMQIMQPLERFRIDQLLLKLIEPDKPVDSIINLFRIGSIHLESSGLG